VKGPVVALCMPERGHVQRLLPIVEGLVARGESVHVLTDARFAAEVTASGGRFADLFARHPLAAADDASIPVPSRYVSFAGVFADAVAAEVAALAPSLVVYDTFAVVAPIVARRLGVPWVNLCAGHAVDPERARAALRRDPRVATSDACHAAVAKLRDAHGLPDADPFSYVDGLSPYLNVYGEPPQFLDEALRKRFEPVGFFGCLAPERRDAASRERPLAGGAAGSRVYVSFGTVIWRYYAPIARAALEALADALAERDAQVLVSLGGHAGADALAPGLARRNVRVAGWVDQWGALRDADLFVSHHGLNSTHEAIHHQVPMLSYPFFGDQPALARRCHELGLARPLAERPRAPLARAAVERALDALAGERDALAERLAAAHAWELATIAGRPEVLDRMLGLR
jgi:MGT family glycosyltransferase